MTRAQQIERDLDRKYIELSRFKEGAPEIKPSNHVTSELKQLTDVFDYEDKEDKEGDALDQQFYRLGRFKEKGENKEVKEVTDVFDYEDKEDKEADALDQ